IAYQSFTRLSAQFVTVSGKNYRPRLRELGGWRWLGAALVITYLLLAVALPLGMLLWASLMPYLAPINWQNLSLVTVKNHVALFNNSTAKTAVLNSVVVALVASTAVVLLAGISGWVIVRERGFRSRLLDLLTFVPLAIPGVIMGIALIFVYLSLPW